jgi:hypothetical protein
LTSERTSDAFFWYRVGVDDALPLTSPNTGMLAVMASWSVFENGLL